MQKMLDDMKEFIGIAFLFAELPRPLLLAAGEAIGLMAEIQKA
jgi:hypothetical protein